jgi:small-conductance mechanosensitive channel
MSFFSDWSTIVKIIVPIAIVILSGLIGFLIEKSLIKFRKNLNPDSLLGQYSGLIKSFEGSITIFSILGAIALILPLLNVPPTLKTLLGKILIILTLGIITILVARFAVNAIRLYSLKSEATVSLTSLFEYLTQVLIYSIGFLIIIQSIGIEITALITAFGVGSLSIGLALQNTLGNLISGVNIIISRKIRPGDYIKLKDGEEGYVMDVELKYTLIKNIYNNIIVIPNRNIIDASFKNFTLEESWMLLPIKIGINYHSDLEKVEKITLNIAQQILDNYQEDTDNFEPFLRYEKFDYYGIIFTVYLRINQYYDRFLITHEFIKKIHKTYNQENIKLAFPLSDSFLLLKDEDGIMNYEL